MRQSDALLTYTRQPDQLYPEKHLRRAIRSFAHPGYLGSYPPLLARAEALSRLGLPSTARSVYLCLASYHTERELLYLVESFQQAQAQAQQAFSDTHLLIVGTIFDKSRLFARKHANMSAVHFMMNHAVSDEELLLCLSAAHVVVLPHFALPNAGVLEPAMLALSHERVIVAPDLPRFRGMLLPRAGTLYTPGSHASLAQALCTVQTKTYQLRAKDKKIIDVEASWREYAHRVVEVYKQLLLDKQ
jgi:glycosyltransferase involved in cell wall biosynthesis